MPGCEPYPLGRNQTGIGVVRLWQMHVHRGHDFRQGMRAGNRQHLWMGLFDHIAAAFSAQAAGDDDLAVFRQRLADGIQRFLHRTVDEAAGVDHHQVGILVGGGNVIAFGTQLSKNLFGIHQRLGATERDKADFGR